MRFIMWTLVLVPTLCTTAAFAIEKTSVEIPFSFQSHGKDFPASQYDVELSEDRNRLMMTNRKNPATRLTWWVMPSDLSPDDATLSIQFDRIGDTHELHMIRLGTHITPVLDAHTSVPPKSQVQVRSHQ
jgi:hypothetical protein